MIDLAGVTRPHARPDPLTPSGRGRPGQRVPRGGWIPTSRLRWMARWASSANPSPARTRTAAKGPRPVRADGPQHHRAEHAGGGGPEMHHGRVEAVEQRRLRRATSSRRCTFGRHGVGQGVGRHELASCRGRYPQVVRDLRQDAGDDEAVRADREGRGGQDDEDTLHRGLRSVPPHRRRARARCRCRCVHGGAQPLPSLGGSVLRSVRGRARRLRGAAITLRRLRTRVEARPTTWWKGVVPDG